jgi:uncharacterized repeat protein (TIGR01451 family)
MRILLGTTLALVLQCGTALCAEPSNPIVLKSIGETEIEVRTPQGTVEKQRVPVQKAPPGAEIIYTTTFANQGRKPAGNVVLTNPIPDHTTYVGGSAFGDNCAITYSVDGGKTFAAPDALKVRTADGRERPALATEYTHIHWVYKGELAPGKVGTAGFRVLVK